MKYSRLLIFSLFMIIITDIFRNLSSVNALNIESATYISAFLNYISICIFILISTKDGFGIDEIPKTLKSLIIAWLIWISFNLIRGAFVASDYYDWKFLMLNSISFSFVTFVFFIGKNLLYSKLLFRIVVQYLFLYGFILIPITLTKSEDLYSRIMIPISLIVLFYPFLRFKWKILVLIVGITSVFLCIGFRSNIIKLAFSVILLLLFYWRKFINIYVLRIIHISLFSIPIIFLTLAITNTYNLFEDISSESYTTTTNSGKEENLTMDTRTFLYYEVFKTLNKTDSWLIGRSAAGSYESEWFINDGGAINGKRYGSEVGILNILLRYGMIGVIIYFLLLYKVSVTAIKSSKNLIAKLIGLFIAFRWTYSFVEEYTQLDLNFFFFWIAIGLVSSKTFREMSDQQIKSYLLLR